MKRILIVDDDLDLLRIVRHVLTTNNYSVTTLPDAENIMQSIDQVKPDLLILDVDLGKWMGTAVCLQIKSGYPELQFPILLFSAEAIEPKILQQCRADGYIQKPVSTPAFLEKIESLTSRKQDEPN